MYAQVKRLAVYSICSSRKTDTDRINFGNLILKFSSLILSVFVCSWFIDFISIDCVYMDLSILVLIIFGM